MVLNVMAALAFVQLTIDTVCIPQMPIPLPTPSLILVILAVKA